MTPRLLTSFLPQAFLVGCLIGLEFISAFGKDAPGAVLHAQIPTWSPGDLDFFLHGSMSTEVVPETVLRAFVRTYPDLFPKSDLSNFGMLPDAEMGWPVGFSRAKVRHLGGLPRGRNCPSRW